MRKAGEFRRLFRMVRGLLFWPFAPFLKYGLPNLTWKKVAEPSQSRDNAAPAPKPPQSRPVLRKPPRQKRLPPTPKPAQPAPRITPAGLKEAKTKTRAVPRAPSRDTPGHAR
jgi:hypothetical protein